jgi:hypothetical protein
VLFPAAGNPDRTIIKTISFIYFDDQCQGAALRNSGLAADVQHQRRYAGDLPVKFNKHIETWGTYREHVEDTFKFDGKTLATIAIWVVATPTLIYTTMIKEYNKADDQAGRKRKDFM